MVDKAISELDDGGAVAGSDTVPIVRSGANYKATLGSMAAEDAADYTPTSSLAAVATSGDPADLSPAVYYPGGTDVAVADGGTGAGTLTGSLIGNGTSAFTAATSSTAGQVLRCTGANTFAYGALDLANSSAVTGLLGTANGGLNNAYFAISGPASSAKTYTFPNASCTVLTSNAVVTVAQGGSGAATLTGILKGNGTSAFSAASAGTDYYAPGSTDVAVADGGTGASTAATALSNLGAVGKQTIWIPAGAIVPSASGGCSALTQTASAANQPDIMHLAFDTTTQEYAQFWVALPKCWNEGTLTARFFWSHASTSTNFGVVWNIQAVAVSDDDTIAVAYGTAVQVADTGGTTNDLYVTSETSAMTIAGTPAVEDMVCFRVSRVTGDASDTMTIDARLQGIKLYFTTDNGNDT